MASKRGWMEKLGFIGVVVVVVTLPILVIVHETQNPRIRKPAPCLDRQGGGGYFDHDRYIACDDFSAAGCVQPCSCSTRCPCWRKGHD